MLFQNDKGGDLWFCFNFRSKFGIRNPGLCLRQEDKFFFFNPSTKLLSLYVLIKFLLC